MIAEKIQTFSVGEGSQTEVLFFTLDLIPVQVVFRYELIKMTSSIPSIFGGEEELVCMVRPKLIKNIRTIEIYQRIIDLSCEVLNLESRQLIEVRNNFSVFNFKKDTHFLEYQYTGCFGRVYYTKSKIHNALKCWEEMEVIYRNNMVDGGNYTDEYLEMYHHYKKIFDELKLQGIFTTRDYHEVSKCTLDKFLINLGK